MEDIEFYGIPVYNFPYDVEEDDEDTIADNSELRVRCCTCFIHDMVGMLTLVLIAGFDAFRYRWQRRGD